MVSSRESSELAVMTRRVPNTAHSKHFVTLIRAIASNAGGCAYCLVLGRMWTGTSAEDRRRQRLAAGGRVALHMPLQAFALPC